MKKEITGKWNILIKCLMGLKDPTAFSIVLLSIVTLTYFAGWNRITPKTVLDYSIGLFFEEKEVIEHEVERRKPRKSKEVESEIERD